MNDNEKHDASLFFAEMLFELFVNIKVVNSKLYNKYICDMTHEEKHKWDNFYNTLKETGWIPK